MNPAQLERHRALGATHWWLRETKRLAATALAAHVPAGGRVLDAGAGGGGLARWLEPARRVIALDVSADALRVAREAGATRAVQATVERLPFADAVFDGVASLDVLYHAAVGDDAGAVREAVRVMRRGAVLVLNLPAYAWMRSAHDDAAGTARRYTRARVRALLEAGGLAPRRVSYRNTVLFPVAVIRRKLLRAEGTDLEAAPPLLNEALALVLRAENAWLRHATLPFGLSVFAVASKP